MKKIALFVDVDNTVISAEQFECILDEINKSGSIVYGKVYGAIDRKNKEIIEKVTNLGFDMAPLMRIKKRGSKVFDNRIFVDVMEMVVANEKIDSVAIVCYPADMVPLFAKLREYGIEIMALPNLDKESSYFVDQYLLIQNQQEYEDNLDEDTDAAVAEFLDGFNADKKAIENEEISEESIEEKSEDIKKEEKAEEIKTEENEAALAEDTKEEEEITETTDVKAEEEKEEVNNEEEKEEEFVEPEVPDDFEDVDTIELLKNVQKVLSDLKNNEEE